MSDEAPQSTVQKLLKVVVPPPESAGSKITIVGVGQVGMACAISILTQVKLVVIENTVTSKECGQNKSYRTSPVMFV